MGAEARSVVVRLSMDTTQAIASARAYGAAVTQSMAQAEAASARQSASMEALAGKAAKGSLVLAAGVALSGKAAVDWESQWAGVEKTVDGTASQMSALEGELRGLAKTMPATHAEIAATAEAAGQLGVAREDVAAFTKTMLMLGETTNLTADDAATQIAQFMNVMKTGADQVDEIGNTLVALGNKGASTEAEIMALTQRLAGAGALVGATEQDVLALASAMANLGIPPELGGGAMQRVFLELYDAASQGEEGIAGFAEVAGMSAAKFAAAWSDDPVAAFDAFVQGLGRVGSEGGNVVETLRSLGLEGTQNEQVLLRLSGSGDMLTKTLQQSREEWVENTALVDEYGERAKTTAAQIQITWNKVKDAGIEAGEALLPVLQATGTVVGTLADSFAALPDPIQSVVVGGTALAAVAGLGFAGFVKLRGAIAGTKAELLGLQRVQGVGALPGVFREVGAAQRELVTAQRESRLVTAQYVGQLQAANLATSRGLPRSIATQNKLADSLTKVEMAQNAARAAGERATAVESRRAEVLRSTGRAASIAAVPIAALALTTTGVADSLGLSNTAQLAMLGTIAGPWGTVIGGGIGALMDFAAANDDVTNSVKRARAEMQNASTFEGMAASVRTAQAAMDDFNSSLEVGDGFFSVLNPAPAARNAKNFVEGIFGESDTEEIKAQVNSVTDAMFDMRKVATSLAVGLGADFTSETLNFESLGRFAPGEGFEKVTVSVADMEAAIATAYPVAREFFPEIVSNVEDLKNLDASQLRAVTDEVERLDSVEGRADALADSLAGLDNELTSTATAAQAFASAIDALMSPQMDQERAAIAWRESLRDLKDDLAVTSRSIKPGTAGGDQNRSVILDRLERLKDVAVAQANNDASGAELAATLRKGKRELLDYADAADLNRREVKDMIAEMNLTPETIRTLLEVSGGDEARATISDLTDRLVDFGLTEAQATAAINDVATGKIKTVQGLMDKYGLSKAEAKALLNDAASAKIRAALNLLDRLDGYSAESTITTTHITRNVAENIFKHKPKVPQALGGFHAKPMADGGYDPMMMGPGDTLYMWREPETKGESFIPHADDHRRPRAKSIAEQTVELFGGEVVWNAGGGIHSFASGGRLGPSAGLGPAGDRMTNSSRGWDLSDTVDAIRRAGRLLAQEYAQNAKGLQGLKRASSAAEKAFDKASDAVDAATSKRDDVMSSVDDLLRRDVFGSDRSPWDGDATDPAEILRENNAEIDAFNKARSSLTKKGLSGAALDALLDEASSVDDVQALASMSKREVQDIAKLFAQRDEKLATSALATGNAAYGAELKEARRYRKEALALQKTANRRLDAMEKHLRDAPKKTGDAVGENVKSAATDARRNRRRD